MQRRILVTILGLLVVGIAVINWRRPQPTEEDAIHPVEIPFEARHDYMDRTLVRDFRDRYPARGWDIEVGAAEVRRMRAGFLRIGAFNELIVSDLHITLTTDSSLTLLSPLFEALGHRHGDEAGGDNPAPSWRHRPLLSCFFDAIGFSQAQADTPISRAEIRQLSVSQTDWLGDEKHLLFRADRARVQRTGLSLSGNVIFATRSGQQLHCREAGLKWHASAQASVREGVLHTAAGTQQMTAVSFPLHALWNDADLNALLATQAPNGD